MKKIIKLLFIAICIFTCINIICADETNETIPTTDSITTQLNAIEAYCKDGSNLGGCIYNKNDKLYTTIEKGEMTLAIPCQDQEHICTAKLNIKNDLKVIRGYQTFDGKGKAVYASCYRLDYKENDGSGTTGLGNGTYFIFNIITENKKGTCVKSRYVIPAEGTESYTTVRNGNLLSGNFGKLEKVIYEYNGKEDSEGYETLTLNKWKAVEGGDCPKVFGYTANTKWYTSSTNRYIFSEDVTDFNIDTLAFWSQEAYDSKPGCTVKDQAGEDTNKELLLSEIKTTINNYSCPSKIEDMINLSDDLLYYYNSLKNDNKYRVLWGKDLASDVIQETETEINKYIKEKLTSCQYKICNITDSEKTNINKNLGTTCKNGCSINNYNKPSTDPDAKCYCCGGSQGCTYTWTTTKGSSCSLQKDIPMGLCIGTTKDQECRNCLVSAYEKAGLSETKSKCLMDSEILKNVTEADLKDANSEAADTALEQEMQENSEIRQNIFNNLIKEPDLDIYTNSMDCATLLGNGLTKVLKFAINTVRIIGVIGTIVIAMIKLLPAVSKGDQSELQKAGKTCIWSAILLIVIVMLPTLIKVIGKLFGFDTSCLL